MCPLQLKFQVVDCWRCTSYNGFLCYLLQFSVNAMYLHTYVESKTCVNTICETVNTICETGAPVYGLGFLWFSQAFHLLKVCALCSVIAVVSGRNWEGRQKSICRVPWSLALRHVYCRNFPVLPSSKQISVFCERKPQE